MTNKHESRAVIIDRTAGKTKVIHFVVESGQDYLNMAVKIREMLKKAPEGLVVQGGLLSASDTIVDVTAPDEEILKLYDESYYSWYGIPCNDEYITMVKSNIGVIDNAGLDNIIIPEATKETDDLRAILAKCEAAGKMDHGFTRYGNGIAWVDGATIYELTLDDEFSEDEIDELNTESLTDEMLEKVISYPNKYHPDNEEYYMKQLERENDHFRAKLMEGHVLDGFPKYD